MGMDRRVSWLLNVIFSTLFSAVGFFLLLLPFSHGLREWMYDAPYENGAGFAVVGGVIFLVGGLLLVVLLQGRGRSAYRTTRKLGEVCLHENVVNGYVERYWGVMFPGHEVVSQVRIRGDQIEIRADLPEISKEKRGEVLKKVESELAELFKETLGYQKEYLLAITFPSEPDDRVSGTTF